MEQTILSKRCPHCGKVLSPSDNPEYFFQCFDCDEDFYFMEARLVDVHFSDPTPEDAAEFSGFHVDLSERVKMTVTDEYLGASGVLFVERSTLERWGAQYAADHAELYWLELAGAYRVKLSENDYYNDVTRNPEKVIPVSFVEIERGTGREVYKGEDGCFYLRENYYPRERCARWLKCGKRRRVDDGDPVRPNLIFECDGERERVRYDDWNDVMAYSDTFNENFHKISDAG